MPDRPLRASDLIATLRVVAAYVIFSGLWIFLSDDLLFVLVQDIDTYNRLQHYKGLFFVFVSALLLFLLLKRELAMRHQSERDRADLLQREQAARARAEAAARAKDELLAVVSHELRTPLTAILGAADVLRQETSLDPEVREMIETIRDGAIQESRIVGDLLDSTSLAAGKLSLSLSQLDIDRVIRSVTSEFAPQLAEKNLRLHLDLKCQARFHGDSGRIAQALRNLLANAAKFTPVAGEIRISSSDSGGNVVVEITDTGIGIAPEVIARLFQPFEQGDRSTTRQHGGVGLGLYLARSIVELHGGTLTGQSGGVNQGTTFTMTLPALSSALPTTPVPSGAALPCEGLAILLVEDNIDTLRLVARLLGRLGCTVHAAQTASQGLQIAAEQKIDLVLSDIGLPDQTGWDLMKHLKAKHSLEGIAFSGFDSDEDLAKSREAGFRTHLVKPLAFPVLQAAMVQFAAELQKRRTGTRPV